MFLLGIGLLFLSTWYLLKLYDNFNDDSKAKKEIRDAWEVAKESAKARNPFAKGRIKAAIDSYRSSMGEDVSTKKD